MPKTKRVIVTLLPIIIIIFINWLTFEHLGGRESDYQECLGKCWVENAWDTMIEERRACIAECEEEYGGWWMKLW